MDIIKKSNSFEVLSTVADEEQFVSSGRNKFTLCGTSVHLLPS